MTSSHRVIAQKSATAIYQLSLLHLYVTKEMALTIKHAREENQQIPNIANEQGKEFACVGRSYRAKHVVVVVLAVSSIVDLTSVEENIGVSLK